MSSRTSRASLGCGCGCVVCTAAGRTSPALATPETQPNPPLIASAPLPCGFSFISFGFKNRAFKFKLLNFSLWGGVLEAADILQVGRPSKHQ